MKHLKIVEAGYSKFNGHFGTVEFKDGVSASPVTTIEKQRLSAILRVEDVGEDVDEVIDMKVTFDTAKKQDASDVEHQPAHEVAIAKKAWTRAELEDVADKHGIKGLREIASAMGINAKSIKELIDAILGA